MAAYLIKRILMMVPLLFGITIITFLVIHLAPGEPVEMQVAMNPKVSAEARERLRKFYELDKPLHVQYAKWVSRLVRLDFGRSFAPDGRPVMKKIKERMPITISLNLIVLLLEFGLAIPIGVMAATHRDGLLDRWTTVFLFLGFATPLFWLSLILIYLFGVKLGWLPISGLHSLGYEAHGIFWKIFDMGKHLIIPIGVATFGSLAGLSRYMRTGMIEVLGQDYITTARAKGLPERVVVYKHALRNALLPAITLLGLSVPGLIGGSVIFESIFAIPGMGQLFYQGVMARDYPLVMGILVIGAVLTLIGNLLADISYAFADPRIRHGREVVT
jgi:peptide/nickel transport system permease protein